MYTQAHRHLHACVHIYIYTHIYVYSQRNVGVKVFFQRTAKTAGGKQQQQNGKSFREKNMKKIPNTLERGLCNNVPALGKYLVMLPF